MRTMEQREERQRELKARLEELPRDPDKLPEKLTIAECARELRVSHGTARRLFRWEPDVEVTYVPGSSRPIVRVPRFVFERVRRRSTNPWS